MLHDRAECLIHNLHGERFASQRHEAWSSKQAQERCFWRYCSNPVRAVSCKGTRRLLRNLVHRISSPSGVMLSSQPHGRGIDPVDRPTALCSPCCPARDYACPKRSTCDWTATKKGIPSFSVKYATIQTRWSFADPTFLAPATPTPAERPAHSRPPLSPVADAGCQEACHFTGQHLPHQEKLTQLRVQGGNGNAIQSLLCNHSIKRGGNS